MTFIQKFANSASGLTARTEINKTIEVANGTGWGDYTDTQYTSGSPLALSANTDTVLPNNASSGPRTQLPEDPANPGTTIDLFDTVNNKIIGRNGDSLALSIEVKVVPASQSSTYIDIWIDIGGSIGELYRSTFAFPKGQGVLRNIVYDPIVYTLDTWETNGGTIYIRSNGTCNVYGAKAVIARIHKAR